MMLAKKYLNVVRGFFLTENLFALSLAFMAFFATFPYFLWKHQFVYFFSITLLTLLVSIIYFFKNGIEKKDFIYGLLLSLFLIYLSILPTSIGEHKKWILLTIPILILFSSPCLIKSRAFDLFSSIVSISAIPGIIVWFLMLLGFHLPFHPLEALNTAKTHYNIFYYSLPGMVIENDVIYKFYDLGQISRLCGMFDEPGRLGTISGLLVASYLMLKDRSKFDNFKLLILSIAGILSFSLAFYMIIIVALFLERKLMFILFLIIALVGLFLFPATPFHYRHMQNKDSFWSEIDNRSSIEMNKLFYHTYLHGSLTVLFFGVSSDANGAYGGDNSTYKSIFTNFGLIGFLYFLGFLLIYSRNCHKKFPFSDYASYFYLVVFCASIYQRPFVWDPCFMLIFTGTLSKILLESTVNQKTFVSSILFALEFSGRCKPKGAAEFTNSK